MQIEELRSTQTALLRSLQTRELKACRQQKLMSVRTVDIKDYVDSLNLEVRRQQALRIMQTAGIQK